MSENKKIRKTKGFTAYSALKLSQNDQEFYYATIPVEELFQYCLVSRREEDAEKGFQRALARDRAEDIAKYLKTSRGSIPTNVVLSAQEIANLSFKSKQINFTRTEGAFLVLDGQHRLWGYQICFEKYKKSHRVPVAIYANLSRADEAKLFIDINTNQRGVPATLLLDIKQVAQLEEGLEPQLRELFDFLNKNESSPLKGLFSPIKSARGKVNRVTFNRALAEPIRAFPELDKAKFQQLTLNYAKALEASLSHFASLGKATVFEAVFSVMDEVIRISIANNRNAKVSSLATVVRSMSVIDLKTTKMSKKDLAEALKTAVRTNINVASVEI